jgi:uncharacterized protein (DUF362 family)
MTFFQKKLNRRQFIKQATIGGLTLAYGCSEKSPVYIDNNWNDPAPLPKTQIALQRTSNRQSGIHRVLELLNVPSMQGKHVVVKPNFNTADPPPASTHNDTLRQIITEANDRGAAGITLAERSFQNFNDVIQIKGIDQLASELGFDIKFLGNDEYSDFNRSDLHWSSGFRLPNTIRDAEYLISTCCLKTHHTGVITMSLKLSVGILPALHMQELHNSQRVNSMIAEINLAYEPDLIIMDGVKVFIDGGPSSGTLADGNVIIAGTDRIAVDAVGTAVLKDLGSPRIYSNIFDLEQLRRARELKLGIEQIDQIEFVTGDGESQSYAETLMGILAAG